MHKKEGAGDRPKLNYGSGSKCLKEANLGKQKNPVRY